MQKALDLSHPVHTAKYLTEAAAACLNHGLQQSTPGSGRLLLLLPITYAQVAEHVKAECPDISNLLLKLQGKTGSKYFTICRSAVSAPLMVSLNLSAMITPTQKHHVKHILADTECKSLVPPAHVSSLVASQPDVAQTASSGHLAKLVPAHSTDSHTASQTPRSTAVLTVRRPAPASSFHHNSYRSAYHNSNADVSFSVLLVAHLSFKPSRDYLYLHVFCP